MTSSDDYSIQVGASSKPPPPARSSTGRYDKLVAEARKAGGEFISLVAATDEAASKLPGLGSRINKGKLKDTKEGEFEARVSVKERTLWIRHLGDVPEVPADEPQTDAQLIEELPTL